MEKKYFITLLLITFLSIVTACKDSAFNERHRAEWKKENYNYLKHKNYDRSYNPNSKFLWRSDSKAGCILKSMGPWMYGGFGKGRWGRKQSWDEMNTNLTFESGAVLDARAKDSSVYVKNLIKRRPNQSSFIYIGPWKYVKKIGKEIRFVATQGNLYGGIRSFYESKTPENAKIKATKKITLARSPEKNMQYCEVLWTKTYGYNGVMDIESNYPSGIFTGKIMKGSGKIIQAEE